MTAHPNRFGIQTPPQHAAWAEILALWQEIDELDYDTAWCFDHFLPIFSDPTGTCLEG
jgi:alkanesulfonate monooxygenase SsuD/methylene tetrahydromethanopterin reductase-like flavin-dependent oxidoreductase (luciferase family)